jgi:hypothetical protein
MFVVATYQGTITAAWLHRRDHWNIIKEAPAALVISLLKPQVDVF